MNPNTRLHLFIQNNEVIAQTRQDVLVARQLDITHLSIYNNHSWNLELCCDVLALALEYGYDRQAITFETSSFPFPTLESYITSESEETYKTIEEYRTIFSQSYHENYLLPNYNSYSPSEQGPFYKQLLRKRFQKSLKNFQVIRK